jgi:hypothetical protein
VSCERWIICEEPYSVQGSLRFKGPRTRVQLLGESLVDDRKVVSLMVSIRDEVLVSVCECCNI